MKNNSLALTTLVVMLVNLVGPVLAPLPAVAAPTRDPVALGVLPAWFTSASSVKGGAETVLPAWFVTGGHNPMSGIQYPATSLLPAWFSLAGQPTDQLVGQPASGDQHLASSSYHTIHRDGVTVSGPSEINNCDPVTFTIVATNDAVTTTNVIVTSTMPTGFMPSRRVFDVGAVAPNQTITLTAFFDAGCDAVSGQNAVTLTQGGGVDPIVVYADFLVSPGAITLRKVPSVIPASVGDVVTWTVIVENTGYGRVDNVAVTDTLGTGLDFVSGDLSASTASLAVGDFLTFTVSARVTECTGLDNDVEATWGCPGQTCQTHTAQASIDLQLNVPYLDYTLPNFDIDYCEGSGTFTIPVVNSGAGTAHNVALSMTNTAPFSITALSGDASYSPDIGFTLPDITGTSGYDLVCELTAVSPCALSPSGGGFDFQLEFEDDCGNPYVLPVKQESWALSGGVPSLSISKDMPNEIYLGEAVTPTITVEAANVGYSPVIVTDTLPPGWTVENADGGNVFTITGQVYITWTVSGNATTVLTPVIRSPVVSDTSACDYCGTRVDNVVQVRATDCWDCELDDSDTASTYIQCEDFMSSHDKQVAPAAAQTCTGFTYTSTYVFASSFNNMPTWYGMIFTDTLLYQAYTPGSASIQLSNGPQSCTATFTVSGTAPLVISNISPTCPITVPGTTMEIVFQSDVAAPGGCDDLTFYDWSYLDLGVTGNGICAADGILEEGVYVTVDAPQMSLGIAGIPANVEPCAEYTITLTLTRLGDVPANDVALRFDTVDYAIVDLLGFGGLTPYFTHTDALSYTWFYSDDFATATTAAVYLRVQRHCDAIGGALATAWYEGNCEDDDEYFEECHVNIGANPPELEPSLIVAKYPELYYADDDVVTWTLTLINSGPATAHEVILTDTLGAGLRYYTSTITTTRGSVAGVIPDVSPDERLITWTLHEVASGAQVTIKFVAEVVDCEDLTNEFSGWQSCLGETCLHKEPKSSYVLLPDTVLINTNNALSPLANCFTRTITATVKNAGLMSVYSATVTENLPPGMFYETGSTRYVVGTGATPPPTGWVAGGEPAGAPLGPLMWSSDQITNLARLYPHETVWIVFDVRADCDFEGGNITIQASYQDVCGDPQYSSASHFAMNAAPPEVAAQKVGRNITIGSGWGDITYAEPGDTVQWLITVTNSSETDALDVVVTDTLPSNVTFVTATLPHIFQNGEVVWDVGTIAGTYTDPTTVEFFITATVNMSECTSADTTNVVTATWGCPFPVCRRIATTQARLRTRPLLYPSATTDLPPATLHQCGGVITATLNNAGLSAYDVTMTDTLPLGFVYSGTVGYSTAPSGTVDLGQTVVYTWAALPTGSTYVAFEVVNDATGGWCAAPSGSNVITVTYDDSGSCADTGPYDAAHVLPVTMATPVLGVNKLPEQQIADVGDVVTWTIVVSNTGTGVADNLTITDVVASNYDSDSITATIGSDGSPPIVVTSTNTITWTPDPILVGGVWTATVSAELVSAGVNRNVVTATTYCDTGCAAATGGDTAYVTLLETFEKNPPIQTGTIGSLVVFGLAISLSDSDALYEGLTLTDTLPAGLGYVDSELAYIYDSGAVGPVISATPTITPGWLDSGDVIWQLGDLSGTVQINGVITAVIQDDPAAYDGARLVNDLRMTYTDDTRPYIYSDTADVDVLEPLLHIGKSYVTPEGCGATLLQDNFNDGDASGWSGSSGWSVVDGVYRTTNDYSVRYSGDTAWTDYSFSAMVRADDDNASMGLRFRYQDDDNYYWFYWQSDRMRLQRRADGTTNTVVDFGPSDGYEPGRWYHVEVRVEGRQIRIYVDGQLRIDYYDLIANAPANGGIGLYSGAGFGVRMFDDVLVTRLGDMACTVGAGDHVTYTIAISNQARLTGYGLVITDAIPNGTSLFTCTMESDDLASVVTAWPVLIPGATGDLVWRINQLAAASPFSPLHHTALTLTVVLAVSEGITANVALPNQASLAYGNWAGGSEPLGVDRDYSGGSHSTAIRSGFPDLNLTKSAAPGIVDLGDSLIYTITVLNTGIVSATGVIITDVLPAHTSFVAATLPHSGPDSSGVITWPLGILDIGESNTVTMVVQVSDTVPSGTIINNTAWLTCTEGISDTDTVTTPLYAALGDYVWEDMDADGVQNEGGTTGVAGVTVTLYTGAGAPLSTTTTDASGYYSFTRLIPGDYYVVFTPPPTYTITFRDQGGDDGLDSDADRTTGQTIVTTLESAERDWTWDVGLYIPASLGDYVWEDANLDGIQNDGPTGIEGVTVTLYTGAGVLTGTTTTDGSGYYSFTNLLPGDYYVVFTPTAGYTFTLQDQGGNDALDSDADVATGRTIIITLDSGEEDWTWDAGLYRMDYGDAPDPTYPTTNGSDGARHVILPAGNPTLGSIVDAETDGQPNINADGDDTLDGSDDEDGVTFDSPLVPGEVATITVSASADASGLLNGWLDFGGDGGWNETIDQIATDLTINAGSSVVITFTVPYTAPQGITTYARFRFSTQGGLTPTGLAPDGEIEDYALPVQEMEYGDLPDGPYPTLFGSDGARHVLDGVTHLGSVIDAEDDGQPSINADGDDGDGSDDEDGVTFITPLMRGQPAQIRVEAGSAGYLNGWIDFDGDGLLDTVNVTVIDGLPVVSTMNDILMTTGVHTFTISVPDVPISSSVYSRFRFTSYDTGGALSFTGLAVDGEVEDYVLMSLGNLVWMDNGAGGGARNDGALNGSESGIPGVELELYRYDDLATPIAATTTDAGGYYRFTGLTPYTYVVHIPASEFGSGEPLDGLLSSTGWGIPDDDDDQDVDENGVDNPIPAIGGISSLSVTLSLGGEPTIEDGDGNSNLTVDFGFYGGRIGDYVWLELVRDGEQGTLFENPIPGVVVDLYDSATGAYLTSDTTDSSGLYLFDDLGLNVTYTVQLSQINFAPGGALYPYTPTIFMAGSATPATDSDGSPDVLFGGFGYAVTTTLTSVISEDLTLDFGFYAEPALELVKRVAPGVAARNMPFTYSIRIQNTGQVTFTAMRLTDTLPSADFHYIGSSGDPADADTIAEPLLVWNDLGILPPGGSLTVSFAVAATPGITGTYWNTATVRVETTPGDVLTATDSVPVDIRDPAVLINKEILGIDRDGVAPDYVTFTIAITNVGPSVIDQLPMVDQYDPYYLSFEDATPYPDSVNDSAGRLVWNDLTASLGNLSPGDSFHVTTVFNIAHEINVTTTNVVTVSDVIDLYENPANDDDDEKEIGGEEDDDGVPTAIEIVYFRAVGEEASVRLEWATAAELNLEGFHIYRAQNSSFDDAQSIGYVPATGPGSTYSYVDRDVTEGQPYWYWLVEEVSVGEPDIYGPVQDGVGIDSLPNHLYLPLVLSNVEGLIQRGQEEQSAVPAPRWADWLSRRWLSLWVELLPESRRM